MNKHIGLIGIDVAEIGPDQTVIYLSDGNQFWNLEPLAIDSLKDDAIILYAKLVAAAFGIPVDLLMVKKEEG